MPSYVLETPNDVLGLDPGVIAGARKSAYEHVRLALDSVKDPLTMMQYFWQEDDLLEFSGRLLHH